MTTPTQSERMPTTFNTHSAAASLPARNTAAKSKIPGTFRKIWETGTYKTCQNFHYVTKRNGSLTIHLNRRQRRWHVLAELKNLIQPSYQKCREDLVRQIAKHQFPVLPMDMLAKGQQRGDIRRIDEM